MYLKRYLLFQGDFFYPNGGAHDFIMSDDNINSLANYAKEMMEKELIDWWHIYDSEAQKVAEGSENAMTPLWE